MKYEPVEYISESQAEERLSIGDPSAIAEVLVASALHVQNVSKVEEWICHYSTHHDPGVRRASALALGHLARIHGAVGDSSLAAVRKLTADAEVSGAAHDALEDVDISTRGQWL